MAKKSRLVFRHIKVTATDAITMVYDRVNGQFKVSLLTEYRDSTLCHGRISTSTTKRR